jgi:ABC-type transporter Mla subunit MlaD
MAYLEGLREAMENLIQDGSSLAQNLNFRRPELEALVSHAQL